MLKIYFRLFILSVLTAYCSPAARVQKVEMTEYNLSSKENAMVDSLIIKKVQPYKERMEADMNQPLAVFAEALDKGQPESKLGNFVSDACLFMTRENYHPSDSHPVDFAFFNNGGLRNSLPKGSVTKGNIFELMPFENELIILTLHAVTVKKIFNFIASKGGVPVAGIKMGIQNGIPANIFINGVVFDSTKVYKVVTSDYLANGGDQCFFLQDAVNREYIGLKIRDALINYLSEKGKKNEIIHTNLDKRITLSNAK